MRIALVDGTKKHTYYPFGLMRISSYLKARGDDVELFYKKLPPVDGWDEVWISAIFTFEIPYVRELIKRYQDKCTVRVGGVSPTLMPEKFEDLDCIVQPGKLLEAEKYSLDYKSLGFRPKYSMSKITDGCIRKCKFCAVHTIESEYMERQKWKDDILSDTSHVIFSDNNYLARPIDELKEDAQYFQWLIKNTKNKYVDFNQALDARLITEEIADILTSYPIRPIRFSYDGKQESGHIDIAIERMAERGAKDFTVFMLYNFTDTIKFTYERMREMVELQEKLGVNITTFPMRYQPIDMVDKKREYTGEHWSVKAKKSFMTMLNHYSLYGQLSFPSVEEFEYWCTDSAEKFEVLMHYPDVLKFYDRKKAELREKRERRKRA